MADIAAAPKVTNEYADVTASKPTAELAEKSAKSCRHRHIGQ